MTTDASIPSGIITHTQAGPRRTDRLRQLANLAGAATQIAATTWVVSSGASENFSGVAAGGDPPLVPAGYAFSIWGPIYAGSLAYAVVQALPANAARDDLRRAGWGTAVAFLATAGWLLVAVRPTLAWATVALFMVIGAGLLVAVGALRLPAHASAPPAGVERWLVRAPLHVFLGWTSVAVFANTAAVLRDTGVTRPGGETGVSLALLGAGTLVAATIARWTGGSRWYTGTVLWALVGIVAANVTGSRGGTNPAVAAAAVLGALVVAGAAVAGARAQRALGARNARR